MLQEERVAVYCTPPQKIGRHQVEEDLKEVATILDFQLKSKVEGELTVEKQRSRGYGREDQKTSKKGESSGDNSASSKRRLPRCHTVVHSCNFPPEAVLLLLAIILTGVVICTDYQAKVAQLEGDLTDKQTRCRHNYTVNMCDDRSIRAQRQFCLSQRLCMERNITEQLSRSIRASNIIGSVLKEFLDGLGSYSLVLIGMFCLWLFLQRRDSKAFTFYQRVAYTEYCSC